MPEEGKENFSAGLKYLKTGEMEAATRAFEKAYRENKENPSYMSYYGMCAALKWGKIGLGIELCTKAIKKEFFKADFYLNLGKVYLEADNRKGAVTVFKKGLGIDKDNEELHEMLVILGVRKRPVIPFLGRSHQINKYLGIFFRRTLPDLLRTKGPERKKEE
ncbi:MAG: hypothetical protein HY883_04195 [Deltaproteobacteria bacterium]|nr:hypothetical protein [Deltaproteobacteria bacterium]